MDEICAYSITGQYGLPRYLFYALLLISIIFHKIDWLVGGTLGASMVYGSIAAAHSVALASARGRATVDLDIIPAFAVTSVSMLVCAPMMVWSKTLREAATSLRTVLFAWMALMFVGVMASTASLKALPAPLPCDNHTTNKTCALNCTITLPIRRRQSIVVVSFKWKSFLFDWSGWFALYGTTFAFAGLVFAMARKHPHDMVRDILRNGDQPSILRRRNAGRINCLAIFAPPISIAFVVVQIVITEVIISGLPLGEDLTSVGQWGPWVGAGFALLGAIIQWAFSRHPIRSPSTSPTSSTPNGPPKPCELSTDIRKGHWDFITDDGVEWRIEDGYLRRVEKPEVVSPDSEPSGSAVDGGNEDSNGCHERVLDIC